MTPHSPPPLRPHLHKSDSPSPTPTPADKAAADGMSADELGRALTAHALFFDILVRSVALTPRSMLVPTIGGPSIPVQVLQLRIRFAVEPATLDGVRRTCGRAAQIRHAPFVKRVHCD